MLRAKLALLAGLATASVSSVDAQILNVLPTTQIIPSGQWHRVQQSTAYLTTLALPVDYTFSFLLRTGTTTSTGWSNLFHVTATGNNCCNYGDRLPGIWFIANTMNLYMTDGSFTEGNDHCADGGNAGALRLRASSTYSLRVEILATFTRLYVNDTLACQERRTQRRAFDTAYVYASDPWYRGASAQISDLTFQASTVPQSYSRHNFIGPSFVPLARGTSLGAIAVPLNYEVGFTIRVGYQVNPDWTNIMQISGTGNDCCNYGDRIPGIWFGRGNQQLYIIDGHASLGTNTGNDQACSNIALQSGQTYNLRLVMNTTAVWVYLNGTQVCTENRNDRSIFGAASVWAASPYYAAADVSMANFYVENLDVDPVTTTLSPGVQSNTISISTLSVAQSQLAVAASQLQVATQSLYTQYRSEQSQTVSMAAATSSQIAALSSSAADASVSLATAMSSQIAALSSSTSATVSGLGSQLSTMKAAINAAVTQLPVASSGPLNVAGDAAVTSDDTSLRLQGNGRAVSFDAECGTISPCDMLRALNSLRQT